MSDSIRSLKEAVNDSAKWVGGWISAGLSSLFGSRAGDSFGILMYHRLSSIPTGVPRPTRNVSPERFQQQMEGLLKAGYLVWPLRDVIQHCSEGKPLPPRVVVITFDDGFKNVFLNGWPTLRRLGIPATIFVATAYLGTGKPFPFDRWGSGLSDRLPADAWEPLSWEDCLEMEASRLIEIGAHTHTHRDFRRDPQGLKQDMQICLLSLEQHLGNHPYSFAFPYGGKRQGFADSSLMKIAREVGVTCALTTEIELVTPTSSPFGWGRFEAVEFDTGITLDAKLKGWYNWVGCLREALRSLRILIPNLRQS